MDFLPIFQKKILQGQEAGFLDRRPADFFEEAKCFIVFLTFFGVKLNSFFFARCKLVNHPSSDVRRFKNKPLVRIVECIV